MSPTDLHSDEVLTDQRRLYRSSHYEKRGNETYLEFIRLVHNGLPAVHYGEIDTSTTFLSIKFTAPLILCGLPWVSNVAPRVNETLALAAEELGLGLQVEIPSLNLKTDEPAKIYGDLRARAPNVFILAEVDASRLGERLEAIREAASRIKANAVCVRLNLLEELVSETTDIGYKDLPSQIPVLAKETGIPVIVAESGRGMSMEVATKLQFAGAAAIDISGYAGVSGMDYSTAAIGKEKKMMIGLDEKFAEWGMPTAVSLLEVKKAVDLPVIASGGLNDGIDIGKCLVLGADLCGLYSPVITRATEGKEALLAFLRQVMVELRTVMLLTGSKTITDLRHVRYQTSRELADWLRIS